MSHDVLFIIGFIMFTVIAIAFSYSWPFLIIALICFFIAILFNFNEGGKITANTCWNCGQEKKPNELHACYKETP